MEINSTHMVKAIEFHENRGLARALTTMNRDPWYKDLDMDTRAAANHFAVAAALRQLLESS